MKEKKNIERLFQEKFKSFAATPPSDAWENISKELTPEKKKRKVVPFWLKLSGVASVLLLGTFLLKNVFTSDQPTEITKTDTTETPVFDSEKNQNTDSDSQNEKSENSIENTDIQLVETKQNKEQEQSSISTSSDRRENQNKKSNSEYITVKQNKNHNLTVVPESKKEQKSDVSTNPEKSDFTEIANHNKDKKSVDSYRNENLSENHIHQKNNQQISPKTEDELLAEAELVQQEIDKLKKIEEENSEENQTETAPFSKWKITPNIAPVTMNSLTEGSSVSENFIENPKENQTTLSYGMAFSYAFSKKFNIRTGINKFSVGYNTNNVEIYASTSTTEILLNAININFNQTSENIVLRPENAFTTNEFSPSTGKINQQFGFIEVPLELSYKLLDNRFAVELIGGMSTLFLNENEVSVISNGMSTVLGEADNLNDVHFSTNLGIGFKYEIFKSFEASLEPMLKYQLGTFSKNDGNFRPYILGLYTGLSFKF